MFSLKVISTKSCYALLLASFSKKRFVLNQQFHGIIPRLSLSRTYRDCRDTTFYLASQSISISLEHYCARDILYQLNLRTRSRNSGHLRSNNPKWTFKRIRRSHDYLSKRRICFHSKFHQSLTISLNFLPDWNPWNPLFLRNVVDHRRHSTLPSWKRSPCSDTFKQSEKKLKKNKQRYRTLQEVEEDWEKNWKKSRRAEED